MTFREAIRAKRKVLKLSQEEAARMVGIARPTYTYYERGLRTPPIDVAARIAKAFDLSLDAIFEINGENMVVVSMPDATKIMQIRNAARYYEVYGKMIADQTARLNEIAAQWECGERR